MAMIVARQFALQTTEGITRRRRRSGAARKVLLIPSILLRTCPTSFQLVEGLVSRPLPAAPTSWKLVGHCAARFSFFQGAGHEGLLRTLARSPTFRRYLLVWRNGSAADASP